ncbi:MAG: glycosyltransferase family 39 protein [Candidatus Desantisbacteria bacterium]
MKVSTKNKKSQKRERIKERGRVPFLLLLSILIVGFLLRLSILNEIEKTGWSGTQLVEGTDMLTYHKDAEGILGGRHPVFAEATTVIYPYFLAAVYFFDKDINRVFFLQMLFAFFCYFLLYLSAKKVFGSLVGYITLILAVFYGPFILYENCLLVDGPIAFSTCIILYLLTRFQERPSLRNGLFVGMAVGFAALFRGNVLIFVPFCLIWMLIILKWKKALLYFSAFACGIALVLLPVTIKNYIDTKEFIPLSAKGGLHFFIGNNPGSTGHSDSYPENIEEIKKRINLCPTISGRSSLYAKEAIRFIREDTSAWLSLLLKKIVVFWGSWEVPNNVEYERFKEHSSILRLPIFLSFGLIAPLGVLGILLCLRRKETFLFSFFILSYFLAVILGLVLGRYRLGVVPGLLVMASYTIFWGYSRFSNKGIKGIILPILLFLALHFLLNFRIYFYQTLHPLLYKNGFCQKKGKYWLIADVPEEGFCMKKKFVSLSQPGQVIKKQLFLRKGLLSRAKTAIVCFAFAGGGEILLKCNGKEMAPIPCPNSNGLTIFGKMEFPVSYLREGENEFVLSYLSGEFNIPLEGLISCKRSFFSQDGKNWQEQKGEFTIRLKIK